MPQAGLFALLTGWLLVSCPGLLETTVNWLLAARTFSHHQRLEQEVRRALSSPQASSASKTLEATEEDLPAPGLHLGLSLLKKWEFPVSLHLVVVGAALLVVILFSSVGLNTGRLRGRPLLDPPRSGELV